MAKKSTGCRSVYQLKVTLAEIRPPIWRRIQVPADTKLPHVHLMLQAAMGWYNCHLHNFTIDGVDYSEPDPDWDDLDFEDERRVRLDQVVDSPGMRFSYLYDFGDGWKHTVLVEKSLPRATGTRYPLCLAGARACPPEDVGGVWGYAEFLKAIRNPKHKEHKTYLEWVGGEFDPEEFDLDEANGVLEDYKSLDAERR